MTPAPDVVALSLDTLRTAAERTAVAHGLVLDLLMREWNGRFATFNVGVPTDTNADPRRRADGTPRGYRLIGRIKAATRADGTALSLLPPVACDAPLTDPADADRWEAFVAALLSALSDEAICRSSQ